MLTTDSKPVKPEVPVVRVLLIDENRTRATAIKSMLSGKENNLKVIGSTSPVEVKKRIVSKLVDVILFGFSTNIRRNDRFIDIFKNKISPPIIGLMETKPDHNEFDIEFQQVLVGSDIDCPLLLNAVHSAVDRKCTSRMVEERMQEYQISEARFLNVILNNADGIIIVNKRKRVLFFNPAAQEMLCTTNYDLRKNGFPYSIEPGLTKELRMGKPGRNGNVLEMRTVETTWEGISAYLISLRDITTRKTAEDSLRKSEERYALAIKGSKDGVWDWDLRSNRIYFCDQWKSMLGYKKDEISDSPQEWFSRIHQADLKRVKRNIDSHIKGETPHFESEFRVLHKDGSWRWMLARGTAVRNKKGKAVRIAGSQGDTTERKKAERQLKKALDDLKFALASEKVLMEELDRKNKELVELSITDGLTGLYNHRFLQERFEFEFKRVRRYGGELSCIIIDIDLFKRVNDTYGHQFGDFVIRQIATIMKTKSREIDICGRYGGEEFMIITNLCANDALKYATKLHSAIENHVFESGAHSIHVTVSMGIADYHNDLKMKQELIERADTALYQAKKDGRNLIRIWKEMEIHDEKTVDKYGIFELKSKFLDLSNQMRSAYMESTNALIKAVDSKDPFAKEHSANVSEYSVEIARALKLSEQEIEIVRYGALLHDIGKISVRDEILVKREKLTTREFELLKRHPEVGVNILKDVKFLEKEIPIILYHHERFDGRGYPQGLRGREIPLGARIVAVADAFDAMVSGRTYKNKLTWKCALEELNNGKGTQFTPEIVDVFVKLIETGHVRVRGSEVQEEHSS